MPTCGHDDCDATIPEVDLGRIAIDLDERLCDECAEAKQQKIDEAQDTLDGRERKRALHQAGLEWEEIQCDATLRDELAWWIDRNYPRSDCGAYYWGPTDSGKTMQGAALAKWWIGNRTDDVVFTTELQMIHDLRPDGDMRYYVEADLLVLDEMGSISDTDWSASHLLAVINGRKRRGMPTYMTSNAPLSSGNCQALEDHRCYDDRACRRINEMCRNGKFIKQLESRWWT